MEELPCFDEEDIDYQPQKDTQKFLLKKEEKNQKKIESQEQYQLRKREKQLRRRKNRAKNKQIYLNTLTEEQKQIQIQKMKSKNNRNLYLQKNQYMKDNLNKGLSLVIDFAYNKNMTLSEIHSLGCQIGFCISYIRELQIPINLTLTNYHNDVKNIYQDKFGSDKWIVKRTEQQVSQYYSEKFQNIIYLSPDADEFLEDVNDNYIYVIGGLVDNKIKKNLSKNQALNQNLKMKKLPLQQAGVKLGFTRSSLNIDRIIRILIMSYQQGNVIDAIRKEFHDKHLENCQKQLNLKNLQKINQLKFFCDCFLKYYKFSKQIFCNKL